jgi:hypothetical protein
MKQKTVEREMGDGMGSGVLRTRMQDRRDGIEQPVFGRSNEAKS